MKTLRLFSAWSLLALIVATSFIFMLGAARGDSAIMDELAHIPAGYSYVRYLDYRLNPEHPPLVKILSGLPLLFAGVNFPVNQPAWQTELNGQWQAGAQFLYESGNNPETILLLARIGPMLLTLGLIVLTYYWARELIGRWWALLPAAMLGFSPTILAHGHYVTTDIGAAFGILLAHYTFVRALTRPTRSRVIWAGIGFGIAQLMKFSAVLLAPSFVAVAAVVWIVKLLRQRYVYDSAEQSSMQKGWQWFLRYAWVVLGTFIIGTVLIYLVYVPLVWNYPITKQVSDTTTLLSSFGNRLFADTDIWMAGNPILRAFGHYFLGVLMVTQRQAGGNTAYFLGEVSAAGSHWYFPTVFLLKESLPSLILIFSALAIAFSHSISNARKGLGTAWRKILEYVETNLPEFSMMTFVAIYWFMSIRSSLNIGFRHIIPTLPFIYILTAGAIKRWCSARPISVATSGLERVTNAARRILSTSIKYGILGILVVWLVSESVYAYPYFLSYFNNLSGGVYNGYAHVTDSNFDWGQDMKRLQAWTQDHLRPGEKIAIDYFGGGNAQYYLGDHAESWWSARGNPSNQGIHWLALSVNTLEGSTAPTSAGFTRKPEDEYRWLPAQPYDKAGTSIFIYEL